MLYRATMLQICSGGTRRVHVVRAVIISAARSAMAITGALVLALVTMGITEGGINNVIRF
jgi:hypothetical protein